MIMKVTPRRHTNLINAAHLPLGVLGIIEEAYLKNHDVTDWLGSVVIRSGGGQIVCIDTGHFWLVENLNTNNLVLSVRKLEPDETITLNNEKEQEDA